jgi:RNA polymerase sigma-70 factor, ECF subfamily
VLPAPPLPPRIAARSTPSSVGADVTDAELAEALRRGVPGAQQAAWRRFMPVVTGMARRRLGGSADVDDVVQEAFLALFCSIKRLREAVALRAFALTITARVLNREVHRRVRAGPVSTGEGALELLACDEPDPAARHAYSVLRGLVDRLRVRERRAFTLRFVAGMNAFEVATALGVSVPTARRVLSSAQKRMSVWASRDPFLVDYMDRQRPAPGSAARAR